MCLVIAKPAGVAMPPCQHFTQGFLNNSHGFGLAYWEKGMAQVQIIKGAMTSQEALAMIKAIPDPVPKTIIMHFRLATFGAQTPGNCHPYPVSKDIADLLALEIKTKYAIAHNGMILNYYCRSGLGGAEEETEDSPDLTDTQHFILDYLVGLGKAIYNQSVRALIEGFTESKFAILDGKGRLELIGKFCKDNGVYYSNTSYKDIYPVVVTKYGSTDTSKSATISSNTWSEGLWWSPKRRMWLNPAYFKPEDFRSTVDIDKRFSKCNSCGILTNVTYDESIQSWLCSKCVDFSKHYGYELGENID